MKNKGLAILLTIVVAVIIFFSIMILYNQERIRNDNRAQYMEKVENKEDITNLIDENEIGNYIVTTNSNEEKISPNATIVFIQYYKDCGHTIKHKEKIENTMVNLSKDELKDIYKDWKLTSFDKDKIELCKEFAGQCDEHYILKENEGHISIYKVGSEGDNILMENTEIETQYLPDLDKENLKNGIEIIGKEKLNSYLENFE